MTNKDERDASVGRLLPDVLKARAADAGGRDCLDAETLAAWADAALDARARADAEAHAANCARCQAMLAAMVKTAPTAVLAASSPWRSRSLWWMAALAPVAAALVVWFAVPRPAPVQQSQSADAIVDQPAPPAAGEATAPRAAIRVPTPAETQTEARNEAPAKDVAAARPSTLAKELDAAPTEQKTLAPPAAAGANAMADARASSVAPPPAAAAEAAPASPAAAQSPRREAFAARSSTVTIDLERQIVSSNPSTRFRLLRGGGVQRSSDGGATWRNEATGATETLTVGSSPSPSVCWLVGPSGAVFLSTDGRSWRRLPFPEAVDLDAVLATDSENASVRTADGRLFGTTDGGRTWTRSPDF